MKLRTFANEVEMDLGSGEMSGYINIDTTPTIDNEDDLVSLTIYLQQDVEYEDTAEMVVDFEYGIPKEDMIKFLEASLKKLQGVVRKGE